MDSNQYINVISTDHNNMESNTNVNSNKIASKVRKLLILSRIVFAIIIASLIFGMVLYNLFTPNERDIPNETIINLLRLLPIKESEGLEWNQTSTQY